MPESSPRNRIGETDRAEIRDNGFTQDVYVAPYRVTEYVLLVIHLMMVYRNTIRCFSLNWKNMALKVLSGYGVKCIEK